ncbi:1-deoxy-D-xylulose 5-phosphate reductoisomerase [Clostridia bacterium]|nr:1-deoxy-D-xylulose 5-phosphate reductoisomerase [Clostridia bacterium]
MKRIAILGSTGSIGTQTLNVVRRHPDLFKVSALTAHSNAALLGAQAAEFRPAFHGLQKDDALNRPEVYDADIVVAAVTGTVGLSVLVNALKRGVKQIALANKEAIVAGGDYAAALIRNHREKGVNVIPVDSEHSAIFQCLRGDEGRELKRVILTASGGPFLRRDPETSENVAKEEVLKHPTFKMGAKISTDSATMVNKGMEVIEAKFLFGLRNEQIDVIVHPQSVIHSIAEFTDGSHFAQMSYPDMEIPIAYALTYPDRVVTGMSARPIDFAALKALTFEPLSETQFPCFRLCRQAMLAGGVMTCALAAADEEAVAAFLAGAIRFTQIYDIIDAVLNTIKNRPARDFEEIMRAEAEARGAAAERIRALHK